MRTQHVPGRHVLEQPTHDAEGHQLDPEGRHGLMDEARHAADEDEHQHADGRRGAGWKMREGQDPLHVDRERHDHEAREGRGGAGGSDEETLPFTRLVGGHGSGTRPTLHGGFLHGLGHFRMHLHLQRMGQ